jgi:proteic killer suppression protein
MTFKNKGLQILFLDGKSAKVHQSHVKKLRLILAKLNTAICASDMNFPGSGLHQLRGEKERFWAVNVNGNWRLVFRFSGENAYDVDYLDYH